MLLSRSSNKDFLYKINASKKKEGIYPKTCQNLVHKDSLSTCVGKCNIGCNHFLKRQRQSTKILLPFNKLHSNSNVPEEPKYSNKFSRTCCSTTASTSSGQQNYRGKTRQLLAENTTLKSN